MENPARDFSFIRPQIFLKGVKRFSTKQIKCKYLHKINEKYNFFIQKFLVLSPTKQPNKTS